MIRFTSYLFILLAMAGRAAASPSSQPVAMLNGSGGNIVCFSGDGSRILTAGKDEARVWDASTFRPVSDPIKNLEDITCASISSDGRRILIGGGTVARVWDAATGRPITEGLRQGGSGPITALLSPDGSIAITAVKDGPSDRPVPTEPYAGDSSVKIWDVATGKVIRQLKHDWYVPFMAISPDGQRLVTVSASLRGKTRLWEIKTGRLLAEEDDAIASWWPPSFSADGERFAAAFWYEFRLFDADSGKLMAKNNDFRHDELLHGVALSPDGATVATATQEARTRVWDALTGKPKRFIGTEMDASCIRFAPDSRLLYIGASTDTGLWNIVTGKRVLDLRDANDTKMPAFSPDGRLIAVPDWKATGIWRIPPQ
jgi:WD40 repeat protein